MIDLNTINQNDKLLQDEVFALQPREDEASFINVHSKSVDVYLIQESMEEWVLEFFNKPLEFRYLFLENIPMINLRWRHYQLDLPIFNAKIIEPKLNFVILQLDSMQVLAKKSYTLPQDIVEEINLNIYSIKEPKSKDIYESIEALEYKVDDVLQDAKLYKLEAL